MAVAIGIAGGGRYPHIAKGMPLIEADDTWRDTRAAKDFVLRRTLTDASQLGCTWVQVVDGTGKPMTQKKAIIESEG